MKKRRQYWALAIDLSFSGVQEHGMQAKKTSELGRTHEDELMKRNYKIKKDNFKTSIVASWVVRQARSSWEVG